MINRNLGIVVQGIAAPPVRYFSCSTGDAASGTATNGRVIDRLGLGGQRIYRAATAWVNAYSTAGSTALDQKVTLSVKLQHGDSSGGGDMADLSTDMQAADRVLLTTAQTTTYQNWSTGTQFFNHQSYYEITKAKRYVRVVANWTRGGSITATAAGADHALVNAGIYFSEGENSPPNADTTSTSTSTST